jgi:signal transduction histidine kinase
MVGRVRRQTPEDSPLRAELREIGEVAQTALENVRGLSQALHPAILGELGLESTIGWYLSTVERQLGIRVTYERDGQVAAADETTAIHVYRVLQEALSNVARHSGTTEAVVRLRGADGLLELEVEDHGRGLEAATARRGLGMVAMAERAELLGGTLEFARPAAGGTLMRLRVPMREPAGSA